MAKQGAVQFTLLKPAEKRHTHSVRPGRSKIVNTEVWKEASNFLQNMRKNRVGPYEIGFVIDLAEPQIKKELSILKNPKLSITFKLREALKKLELKDVKVVQQGDEIAVVGRGAEE